MNLTILSILREKKVFFCESCSNVLNKDEWRIKLAEMIREQKKEMQIALEGEVWKTLEDKEFEMLQYVMVYKSLYRLEIELEKKGISRYEIFHYLITLHHCRLILFMDERFRDEFGVFTYRKLEILPELIEKVGFDQDLLIRMVRGENMNFKF